MYGGFPGGNQQQRGYPGSNGATYGGQQANQGYSRPAYAPPNQQQQYDFGYGQNGYSQQQFQQQGQEYNRPAAAPQGWSSQQIQEQANSQSVYQQHQPNQGVRLQQASGGLQTPSAQPQSFGVNGYNYQYSTCTGRKKALLVGINYIGTNNQLNGCINDVTNVSQFLERNCGFTKDNMVILVETNTNRRAVPLRQNIIDGMKWLVKDAKPNDSLFFHYSGHGGQTKDLDGDEYDGNDETIYPLDFEQSGMIVDDEMHQLLVDTLPAGVRLTALFDSCHSGSALDLPYSYSTRGVEKEPNLAKEAGEGLLGAVTSYMQGDMSGVLSKATGLFGLLTSGGPNQAAIDKTKQTKTSAADVIMISGCKDDQTSADAKENGVSTGAMSYSFITVMSSGQEQSYLTLLQNMRKVLSGKYTQKPQLSASHPIDTNLKFIV
ncbi:unnamed protein product [Kuraishia capsulata CBS 1993]|uniref:Metacaspase-1 n=1 Tax=Kuraishia capsulata CBS 1993 TaxID=1382522 RepID=W6MUK8_9ASCO|nr:uncharacterized protein KUCA_T00001685001 [Kuraishia capsulata CBS 1993]CDK25715.1 unnamed protein product [Kuraishia capsulata CBS 1993]